MTKNNYVTTNVVKEASTKEHVVVMWYLEFDWS